MKKISLIAALLMVAALLLAACGGADTDGAASTPGAPGAQIPVTGDNDCNRYTVHGLLDMEVVDAQGNQIGDVDSLIILHDTTAMNMNAAAGTGTPQSATAPAAAAGGAAETGNEVVTTAAPRVAYVIVDVENEDNNAVVPLQAFDLTVRDRGVQGGVVTAMATAEATAEATVDPNQTPAADATGAATTTNGTAADVANELDVCTITLNNVQADAFSQVPRLDPDADFSVDTWDEAFRTYWTGQGVVIPAAGANNLGAPVILGDEFNNVDARNTNGDDLGEIEDFFLDQETGNITYGVLATGGFLGIGEERVPVPANRFQWFSDDPGDKNDAGTVVINLNEGAWQNAPTLTTPSIQP